jgi:hypothetical protein
MKNFNFNGEYYGKYHGKYNFNKYYYHFYYNGKINGIYIDTVNTGAVGHATTSTILQWGLGVGATVEDQSLADSATRKAARRASLGFQYFPVNAPIGMQANLIKIKVDITNPD